MLIYDVRNQIEYEEGLVSIATKYFREIFDSSNPTWIAESLSSVSTFITVAMNDELTKRISEWEVKWVIFAMHLKRHPDLIV